MSDEFRTAALKRAATTHDISKLDTQITNDQVWNKRFIAVSGLQDGCKGHMTVREEGAYSEALSKINYDLKFVEIVEGEVEKCKTFLNKRKEVLQIKKTKQEEEASSSNKNKEQPAVFQSTANNDEIDCSDNTLNRVYDEYVHNLARTSAIRIAQVVEDTPNSSLQPNQHPLPPPVYVIYDTDEEAHENEENKPAAEETNDTDNAYCAICNKTFKNAKGLKSHNRVHRRK